MKSIHQVNNNGDRFIIPTNTVTRVDQINNGIKEYKTSLSFQKNVEELNKNIKNNNYEYLDSTHLKMLDLNQNIHNMLQKPVKPYINLESLCKETNATLKNNNTSINIKNGEQQKNVKHLYELGSPQVIGTYIQPLNEKQTSILKEKNLINNGLPLVSPPSPFFHPPNFSTKLTNPANQFLSLNLNKPTNMYGFPSYIIPESKPQNLTVTVLPNKDKEILEKEAKHFKFLLDSSSQGIVNSTPDYQKIISSNLSNNNDKESDFSFGKNEVFENTQEEYIYENSTEKNYNDSFINDMYDINNCSYEQMNEFLNNSEYKNENLIGSESNKQTEKTNKELDQQKNVFNNLSNLKDNEHSNAHEYESENKFQSENVNMSHSENANTSHSENINKLQNENENEIKKASPSKKIQPIKKKETNFLQKKHELSTCFKNSKTYINIRLGRPKKFYITNSSDPIDKKLKEWHNTHNSQVGWKKMRRGVYTFGKTEVALSLVHDKIIVKKINGKDIKDNLLTVEKFVSLNEFYELQKEESDNE